MVINMKKKTGIYKNKPQKAVSDKSKLYKNAIGVIEIILILVILIGLVIIFKDEIEQLVNDAINSLTGKAGKII